MDGQALIDTAEGAHAEVEFLLQRMREIAVQASNDTNGTADRTSLQAEISQLTSEINRIAATTTWSGSYLLNGDGADGVISSTADATNTFNLQIASNESGTADTLAVAIKAIDATSLGVGGTASAATVAISTVTQGGGTFNATSVGGVVTFTANASDAAPADATKNIVTFTVDGTSFTFNAHTHGSEKGYKSTATGIGEAFVQFLEDQTSLQGYTFSNTTGAVTIQKSNGVSVASNSAAQTAMTSIDAAIDELNAQRANLGAYSNRLDSTVKNLTNIVTNLEAGRGRVEDADFAAETTNLAKAQILQQASMAMLAQANASKQGVLSLLQR
jgi:flagellin